MVHECSHHHRDEERRRRETAKQAEQQQNRTPHFGKEDQHDADLVAHIQRIGKVLNERLVLQRLGNPVTQHQDGHRNPE